MKKAIANRTEGYGTARSIDWSEDVCRCGIRGYTRGSGGCPTYGCVMCRHDKEAEVRVWNLTGGLLYVFDPIF